MTWARQSELASGLEAELALFLQTWLASAWPFRTILLNGVETTLSPKSGA